MTKPTLYAIFSHINPQQVIRLACTVRALSPTAHIVVHHDPGHPPIDARQLELAGAHLIPDPVAGEWGDFSQVQQHLHVMRWCRNNLDFEWFITLTGQTYPIKPLAEFESMLAVAPHDAFVEHFDAYNPAIWPLGEAVRRYHYRFVTLPKFRYWHRIPAFVRVAVPRLFRAFNASQPLFRIFTYPKGLRTRLGILTPHRPFGGDGLRLIGANQNTNYRRNAIEYMLDYVDARPAYLEYFRRTALPDEAFFATALCSSPTLRVSNDNLRFIHWPGPQAASGGVLTRDQLPELEASQAWFALKFDERVCPEVLDALDQRLGLPMTRYS